MDAMSKKWLKVRIFTLLLFFLLLFVGLVSRAFQLQILSSKYLQTLAKKQHTKILFIPPERGIIFDRNGEKLAASHMESSIFADPSKVVNARETADKISAILSLDRVATLKKISVEKNFIWLARKIPSDLSTKVENAHIPGIFTVKEPKRFYPNGSLAGHVLGFVGLDDAGLEGLEVEYDENLRGTPEKMVWARDAKNKRLYLQSDDSRTERTDSYDLILTIDSRIQHLAETQLKEAVTNKGAKGGIAIIMDPRTGEILAMANEKDFDPNEYGSYGAGEGRNRAVTDYFDPGSTFKPFLVAAALEERVVKPNDRFFCENGNYVVADRVIHEANRKRYGYLALKDILKYSSNIGSAKVAEKLGKDRFYQYISKFGFGVKTGIDLPGESPGLLRPAQRWRKVDTATIAFGQGISVTAVQLITALSAIANDGVLMKPFVVRAVVDKQGKPLKTYRPTVVRRVVSAATARELSSMLKDVVGAPDGTGKNARIENVDVAGKTGTAQKFDFARRVYSSERVKTSFMGFFPVEDPQIAILVILDEPQKDRWGGVAAAPVFKHIGEQILTSLRTPLRRDPLPLPQEELHQTGLKLVSAVPAELEQERLAVEDAESVMPDFRGMTMRDALRKARTGSIEIKTRGSGWAIRQEPAAGTPIGDFPVCTVFFEN